MRHTVVMQQLVATLVLLASLRATSATAGRDTAVLDRPGGIYSIKCGHEGMAACTEACTNTEHPPEWCPSPLTDQGCMEGLTRLEVTPSIKVTDDMPDICLALPPAGQGCGASGKPCCILPRITQPSKMVRPLCGEGLSCMIPDPVTSLPYGGTTHLQAVLRYPGSQGLLAANVMGTCRSAPVVHEAEADPPGPHAADGAQDVVNSVLGQCGVGHARCPRGTYCASNEDSLLGGSRCVPMPDCGGAYQQCCPPYSNGEPAILSIVDKRTAVPTCNGPDAVCVWKPTVDTYDPSSDNEAFQPMTPPGSVSMMMQYPNTLCIPNLVKCGQAGQPCCPHAQFARSNHNLYFRLHVCDAGLRCNDTISLFSPKGSKPVLGVCKGTEQTCGRLGQKCCSHIDQAGWEWRHCADGQPGVFCGADNKCTHCPSSVPDEAGMRQASINALSLPGVGNAC